MGYHRLIYVNLLTFFFEWLTVNKMISKLRQTILENNNVGAGKKSSCPDYHFGTRMMLHRGISTFDNRVEDLIQTTYRD